MKTAIFITIIFVISILSNYLNYRTALIYNQYQSTRTTESTTQPIIICARVIMVIKIHCFNTRQMLAALWGEPENPLACCIRSFESNDCYIRVFQA